MARWEHWLDIQLRLVEAEESCRPSRFQLIDSAGPRGTWPRDYQELRQAVGDTLGALSEELSGSREMTLLALDSHGVQLSSFSFQLRGRAAPSGPSEAQERVSLARGMGVVAETMESLSRMQREAMERLEERLERATSANFEMLEVVRSLAKEEHAQRAELLREEGKQARLLAMMERLGPGIDLLLGSAAAWAE